MINYQFINNNMAISKNKLTKLITEIYPAIEQSIKKLSATIITYPKKQLAKDIFDATGYKISISRIEQLSCYHKAINNYKIAGSDRILEIDNKTLEECREIFKIKDNMIYRRAYYFYGKYGRFPHLINKRTSNLIVISTAPILSLYPKIKHFIELSSRIYTIKDAVNDAKKMGFDISIFEVRQLLHYVWGKNNIAIKNCNIVDQFDGKTIKECNDLLKEITISSIYFYFSYFFGKYGRFPHLASARNGKRKKKIIVNN
jgi:hypothetical protein